MTKKLGTEKDLVADRFRLKYYVKSGGQGEVWAAQDTTDQNRKVAVKLFPDGPLSRAKDEVQAMTEIQNDRLINFIETNIGSEEADSSLYIAMEFAKNGNLRNHDYFRGDIDLSIELFCEICKGVSAIHAAGFIHRDLKPSNILVCDDQRDFKVGDFGLCLPPNDEDRDKTPFRENVGPIYFTAPEQTSNPPTTTVKSDIYSLGRILHWMITGKYEHSPADQYKPISSIMGKKEQLEIDRIIERMVSFSPKDRPDSVEEVVSKLQIESVATDEPRVVKVSADQAILRNFMMSTHGSVHLRDLVEHMSIIYGVERDSTKRNIMSSSFLRYSWRDIAMQTLNDLNQLVELEVIEQSGNTFRLLEEH